MAYETLKAGSHPAKLIDWGVKMAANKPMAFLKFEVACGGDAHTLYYEQWFLTKEGAPNKALQTTLETVEFKGSIENFSNGSFMNTSKDYMVTVEQDGQYWRLKWINDPNGASAPSKKVSADQLDAATKAKINAMFSKSNKNSASQEAGPTDDLPF